MIIDALWGKFSVGHNDFYRKRQMWEFGKTEYLIWLLFFWQWRRSLVAPNNAAFHLSSKSELGMMPGWVGRASLLLASLAPSEQYVIKKTKPDAVTRSVTHSVLINVASSNIKSLRLPFHLKGVFLKTQPAKNEKKKIQLIYNATHH